MGEVSGMWKGFHAPVIERTKRKTNFSVPLTAWAPAEVGAGYPSVKAIDF
jgi:hypothetical protein